MMSDILERLRDPDFFSRTGRPEEIKAAADEIERLRERCAAYKGQVKWGEDVIAARLPDREGWQSIETAPKDNTAILVYSPVGSNSVILPPINFVATAFWDTAKGDWFLAWTGLENKSVKLGNPTHWRPLPPPPRPEEQTKESDK